MAETNSWIKVFRRAIKVSVGTGWTVQPDRGNIRVLYGKKASGFLSINLPYKWQEDQWVEALKLIETAADTYQNYKSNISLKAAFDISQKSSTKFELEWDMALENYRNSNRHTIQENTWKRKHLPVIKAIFFYVKRSKARPQNGKRLWNKVSNEYQHGKNLEKRGWAKGTTMRRHMRLAFNRFLNWCVEREDFPSYWRPPVFNKAEEEVTTEKRVGYPLTDSQIGRLVDSFADNEHAAKWQFATQLCAVYGLRPEELRYLVLKNNKTELWTTYKKSNSKINGRRLFPLFVLDIDGNPFDWCLTLQQRFAAGELLPQISKGQGADRLGKQLRDRSPKNIWLSICKEAEVEGQECTPYSFRHRYAYVAHNRINKNGTYRSPKQIADAMGHDLETHLKSYSRFNTKDLENAFDPIVDKLNNTDKKLIKN